MVDQQRLYDNEEQYVCGDCLDYAREKCESENRDSFDGKQ